MAATSRVHEWKSAVVDALSARPGLAGVQVSSADIGRDTAGAEYIAFVGEDTIEQEWAAIGRLSREETITLTGAIYVLRPGAGEAIVREARARALALMAEIEAANTADPSWGNVVRMALARPAELVELATPEGRVALLRFELRANARLQAS